MTLLLLEIFFGIGMFLHIMVFARAFRLKMSIVGFLTGSVSSLGYVIYGFSIKNYGGDYNYFITAQEYSIFRWALMFGFQQIIDQMFIHSRANFYSKLVPFIFMGTIVGVNIIAVIYNLESRGIGIGRLGFFH
jgi:hypothetical protein